MYANSNPSSPSHFQSGSGFQEHLKKMEKRSKKTPQVHKCTLCPYSTTNVKCYNQHKLTHSADKPFKCPECPFRAKWKTNVKHHFETVHQPESRPFPCSHPGCNYAAKQKHKLNQHLKIHCEGKLFSCSHPNCNYSANQKGNLIRHARVHSGEKPFVCQFESCSYATAHLNALVAHSRTHTKEKPFKCPQPNCEYSATQQGNLNQHQLAHHPKESEERPTFSCPLCEYSTQYKSSLSSHNKYKHTLEKPFACSFESCEHRCKTQKLLSDHLKTVHSEERRYKCELCPFRGKLRETVIKHLKNIHADPNFRPFKCTEPQCDSTFKTKAHLKSHLLLHKPEKMFSCSFPDCGYQAHTKYRIEGHEYNIHSEEKREKCLLCDFRCKTKSNLTVHVRTHTKEQPYKCKEQACEYQGKISSDLKAHQKKCHPLISKQNI